MSSAAPVRVGWRSVFMLPATGTRLAGRSPAQLHAFWHANVPERATLPWLPRDSTSYTLFRVFAPTTGRHDGEASRQPARPRGDGVSHGTAHASVRDGR